MNSDDNKDKSKKRIKKICDYYVSKYSHILCGYTINLGDNGYHKVFLEFIGGPGTNLWPRTQAVFELYLSITNEIRDNIFTLTGDEVEMYYHTTSECEKDKESITESKMKTFDLGKKTKKEKYIAEYVDSSINKSCLSDNFYGVTADIYDTDYGKTCHITFLFKDSFTGKESDCLHDNSKIIKQSVKKYFEGYINDVTGSNTTIEMYLKHKKWYDSRKPNKDNVNESKIIKEGSKNRALEMIEKYGLKSAINFFGGLIEFLDIVDMNDIPKEFKIDYIKNITRDLDDGIELEDVDIIVRDDNNEYIKVGWLGRLSVYLYHYNKSDWYREDIRGSYDNLPNHALDDIIGYLNGVGL